MGVLLQVGVGVAVGSKGGCRNCKFGVHLEGRLRVARQLSVVQVAVDKLLQCPEIEPLQFAPQVLGDVFSPELETQRRTRTHTDGGGAGTHARRWRSGAAHRKSKTEMLDGQERTSVKAP